MVIHQVLPLNQQANRLSKQYVLQLMLESCTTNKISQHFMSDLTTFLSSLTKRSRNLTTQTLSATTPRVMLH